MKVFDYFKKIYTGRGTFAKHIMIFSYVGILALCINNLISVVSGYLLITPLLNIQITKPLQYVNLILGCLIFFRLTGFEYCFVNNILSQRKFELPEFDIRAYGIFLRMLPLFLLWHFYFLSAFIICMTVIAKFDTNIYEFIPLSLLLCMIPFINFIFVMYAKDFYFKKVFLNPILIVDIIATTYKKFIVFILQFAILLLLICSVIYCSVLTLNLTTELKLFILCILFYFAYILKLVFMGGIAEITTEKYLLFKH